MFKGLGLHNVLQKTKTAEIAAKRPDLTSVQSGESLLASPKRQQHLKTIKSLLNLPPKLYDSLYYGVIENFAEFTQSLPETQYGMFANEGGFLDHGLERAARALSLCLNYFFPEEKSFQSASSQQALWIYAVFTAGLLLDVGKIAVKYQVEICNRDGSTIKEWLPYSGAMNKTGRYYRFNYTKENRDNLKRLVTSLLARQILEATRDELEETGTNGFAWIASNPDVLETWLHLLQGERRLPMASYLAVIPLADAQIIDSFLAIKPTNPSIVPTQPFTNSPFDTPQTPNIQGQGMPFDAKAIPGKMDIGREFLLWLRENTNHGNLSINQLTSNSDMHVVEEGVLLNPDLFKRFTEDQAYAKNITPDSVETQFRRILEIYFDSPATLLHRYNTIKGVPNVNLQRYALVSSQLIYGQDFQPPEINKQILMQQPAQPENKLPMVEPTQNVQQQPTLTFNG